MMTNHTKNAITLNLNLYPLTLKNFSADVTLLRKARIYVGSPEDLSNWVQATHLRDEGRYCFVIRAADGSGLFLVEGGGADIAKEMRNRYKRSAKDYGSHRPLPIEGDLVCWVAATIPPHSWKQGLRISKDEKTKRMLKGLRDILQRNLLALFPAIQVRTRITKSEVHGVEVTRGGKVSLLAKKFQNETMIGVPVPIVQGVFPVEGSRLERYLNDPDPANSSESDLDGFTVSSTEPVQGTFEDLKVAPPTVEDEEGTSNNAVEAASPDDIEGSVPTPPESSTEAMPKGSDLMKYLTPDMKLEIMKAANSNGDQATAEAAFKSFSVDEFLSVAGNR